MRVRTSVPVVIYLCATGGREARAAYSCSNSTCVNSRAGMFQLFEYCSCLFSSTVALSLSLSPLLSADRFTFFPILLQESSETGEEVAILHRRAPVSHTLSNLEPAREPKGPPAPRRVPVITYIHPPFFTD